MNIIIPQGILLLLLSIFRYATAQCNPQEYTKYVDKHVSGGSLQATYTTLAACQTGCSANPAQCVAIDWVEASNQCWFVGNYDSPIVDLVGVDHYRKEAGCASTADTRYCTVRFMGAKRFINTYNIVTTVAASIQDCAKACVSNSQCTALEWSTGQCRLYTAAIGGLQTVNDVSYQVYVTMNCTDCPVFKMYESTRITSVGLPQATYTTVDTCQQACLKNVNCFGIDFVATGTTKCYFIQTTNPTRIDDMSSVYYNLECRGQQSTCFTWRNMPNTHAFGGIAHVSATTENDCTAACMADTTCLGVDVDSNPEAQVLCWFHTNSDDFTKTSSMAGVTLYIKEGCATCNPLWENSTDTHAYNGIPKPEYTTADLCLDACVADTTCQGVDVDISGNILCWFHTLAADFNNLARQTGVNMYRLVDRCPNVTTSPTTTQSSGYAPLWTTLANTHAMGGIPRVEYTTEADCKNACVNNVSCVGVDVDTVNFPLCWFHVKRDDFLNTESMLGTTLYQLSNRYSSGCIPTWTEKPDTSSGGGQPVTTATDEAACKQVCINDISCVAIDLDLNPDAVATCWTHNNSNNLLSTRVTPGINQYIINRDCSVLTTVSSTSSCVDQWDIRNNTGSPNGTPEPAATTLADCQKACADNDQCVAIDVDYNAGANLCWLHLQASNLETMRSQINVFQYRIIRCGEATTTVTTTSSCVNQWDTRNNTGSPGGTPEPAATTLADCQKACVDNDQCVAIDVDYNAGANLCWLHLQASNLDTIRVQTSVYQYRIIRCGETTESTTTTSTTTSTTTTTTTASTTSSTKLTTPTTMTTASGCIPEWRVTYNTHAFGGVAYSQATTEEACRAACVADETCTGVDVDTNPAAVAVCWFHTRREDFSDTGPMNGVTLHELIDRCPATTTTSNNTVCTPSWKITDNTHAFNGEPYTAAKTEEECLAFCVSDETCVGVDVDSNPSVVVLCWLHRDSADFSDTERMDGVKLYELDRCPAACTPLWDITNGTHASYGTVKSTLTTAKDCENGCLSDADCKGFDLDYNEPVTRLCWFHYNDQDFLDENLQVTENTYMYRLIDRCPSSATTVRPTTFTVTERTTTRTGCVPQWDIMNNTHAFKGQAISNATTIDQCLAACLEDTNCVAVDLDFNGAVLCWLHTDVRDLTNVEPSTNVYLYKKLDDCKNDTTTEPTTSSECIPAWTTFTNNNAPNGVIVPDVGTEQACLQACIDDMACVGVDVDKIDGPTKPIVCWKHLNTNDLAMRSPYTSVDLWILDRCPSSGAVWNDPDQKNQAEE